MARPFCFFVLNCLLDSILPFAYDLVVLIEFEGSEDLKHLFLVVLEFKANEDVAVLKSRSLLLFSSSRLTLSFLATLSSFFALGGGLLEAESDFSLSVDKVVEEGVHVVVNFTNLRPSSCKEILFGLFLKVLCFLKDRKHLRLPKVLTEVRNDGVEHDQKCFDKVEQNEWVGLV